MKPVCVRCHCFYRPKKNGFMFIESMPNGMGHPDHNIRGTRYPNAWQPYKLWRGDLWECPDCFHEIVVGVAPAPIVEHWEPRFDAVVESLGGLDLLRVNDC